MKSLAVAWVVVGWLSAAAAAAPILSVNQTSYAVTVQSGSRVSHTFVVTNTGDEVLKILSVRTSCGCTTAALAKRELAPGESVNIDATVNTTGFHGTQTRTLTVSSNDPIHPDVILRIEATIADAAIVVPERTVGDLFRNFYVLLDVRTPEEYAAGHLLGAMNLPLAELQTSLAAWTASLPREVLLVVYGAETEDALTAGRLLIGAGLMNTVALTGGIAEWTRQFGDEMLRAP